LSEGGGSLKYIILAIAIIAAPLAIVFLFFVFMIDPSLKFDGDDNGTGVEVSSGACGDTVTTLVDGFEMMPRTGKLGLEQHLSLKSPQESASTHYQLSNTPDYARNGMAGGAGGLNTGNPTVENERWASNTQWRWWLTSSGNSNPCQDRKCQQARSKTPHSRIVMTNKKTGKSVVTSAEESGPALWVTQQDGRNWGGTGEIFHYLKEGDNSAWPEVEVAFAKDQQTPLGPCDN